MTTPSIEKNRADFDRIAGLLSRRPERPEPYDAFVVRQIPPGCGHLLEVGSGAGRLARLLARRARTVAGIDASPGMVELARARSSEPNLHFVCADFMTHDFGASTFDAVVSVATLHHLPFGPAIERMKALLVPGGVMVVHDVRAMSGWPDRVWSAVRAAASGEAWRWLGHRVSERGELARAWHEHGAAETYATTADVRAQCDVHLPGARVYSHPLWRYSIVWTRPGGRIR